MVVNTQRNNTVYFRYFYVLCRVKYQQSDENSKLLARHKRETNNGYFIAVIISRLIAVCWWCGLRAILKEKSTIRASRRR